jgi:hypothetical protein
MREQIFKPGDKAFLASDCLTGSYSAVFEDDGETGYFYAPDRARPGQMILDAVHICNVKNISDRDRTSSLLIVWSGDGTKCALLINRYPHAVFDFSARRGFCRTNFPNFRDTQSRNWDRSDHAWSDEAMAQLQ